MDLVILLVRTLFFYALIMLVMTVFTRRRKLTIADLLIAFMVTQFSVLAIDNPGRPLLLILMPILLLLILHIAAKPILQKDLFKQKEHQSEADAAWREWKREGSSLPGLRMRSADVEMAAMEPASIYPAVGQLPLPLILDGKVLDENLEKLGKTRFWLKNETQRYGVRKFREVAYCSMDRYGRMFLDRKKP